MKKYTIITLSIITLIIASGCSITIGNSKPGIAALTDPSAPSSASADSVAQDDETIENKIVTLKTNKGDIKIELFLDKAPITAGNFLKLAKSDFYDGVTFHRVIPNFMIQGGDPLSKDDNPDNDGQGGPGYFIEDEFSPEFSNVRGAVSMANAGPGTGGSQFFINTVDNTFLDYDKEPLSSKHPVFGRVVEGMAVVDAIASVATSGPPNNRPIEDVIIQNVVVE